MAGSEELVIQRQQTLPVDNPEARYPFCCDEGRGAQRDLKFEEELLAEGFDFPRPIAVDYKRRRCEIAAACTIIETGKCALAAAGMLAQVP